MIWLAFKKSNNLVGISIMLYVVYNILQWHSTYRTTIFDCNTFQCIIIHSAARPCCYTMLATFRTIGDISVSAGSLWRLVHGLQNPIISSWMVVGKHIRWKGDNQSARKVPARSTFFGLRPKTSTTPASAEDPALSSAPGPALRRSMWVMLDVTTPAWSHIMQLVNRPNSIASMNNPRTLMSCVGLSRQVKWWVRTCPCRPMQSKNLVVRRVREYTQDKHV
mmetsp:Transcript_16923/g.38671  ORF Transcript_16923/g.38671 Transcript_16923/m.38671 type:complete len:221 (+) Transcript_16923:2036-2698(+)